MKVKQKGENYIYYVIGKNLKKLRKQNDFTPKISRCKRLRIKLYWKPCKW